jgi:hypothetical protein
VPAPADAGLPRQGQAAAKRRPSSAADEDASSEDFALYQSAIEVVRLTVADQSGNETFTVPMNETFTVPMNESFTVPMMAP